MTQSGVSQALQALEQALGVTLLSRGREGISATEIGHQVLSDARSALQAVDRVREHCGSWAGLDKGTLRIGSVSSFATRLLPDRLRAFRTKYPGIQIALLEGSDEEVCEWVSHGAADIGLTAKSTKELDGEIVAEDDFVVVVERRHPLASTRPISIRALVGHPFIMSAAGCEPVIRSFFEESGCAPDVAFAVRDMTALFEMVRQGLGITIVPSLSLPNDRANLRILELRPARRRSLLAVTKTQGQRIPAVQAFLGFLRGKETSLARGILTGAIP